MDLKGVMLNEINKKKCGMISPICGKKKKKKPKTKTKKEKKKANKSKDIHTEIKSVIIRGEGMGGGKRLKGINCTVLDEKLHFWW